MRPDFPTELSECHLVLFMTGGMSLAAWDALGMLDREVEIYRRLAGRCASVSIVSYGDAADLALASRLPEIRIICNRWRLPRTLYAAYLAGVALRGLRGKLIVKTNQTHGGDLALRVARRLDGRFVARCGYLISFVGDQKFGTGSAGAERERALERQLFCAADRVVVTTEAMRQTAAGYGIAPQRIAVIPNYAVMEWFAPPPDYAAGVRRIAFVGRLSDEKNLPALIAAAAARDIELVLVGDGPDRPQLEALAQARGCRASFLGRRAYRDIPGILATCQLFVLPSLYEGHPKALIEGMASGLPVIGSDVPGIREAIDHGETGWLTAPDADALAQAIGRLANDAALRRRLGEAARQRIGATLSLDRILELETGMLSAVARGS